MNRRVFLDSSFWIAVRDTHEAEHHHAQEILKVMARERNFLVVSVLILAETHAYFSKRPFLSRQILDDFESNPILISESVAPEDEKAAVLLLRRQNDKTYSFCDAVSFVMMRRLGIRRAVSFDQHFRQFGEFEIIS